MRCVLYLRMSRDTQESSIGDQRTVLIKHASTKGYQVVSEYVDEGISGDATEKRVAFQKMMKDCGSDRFDLVLVWNLDRFGRFDPLEAGYWIKPMRDAGVVLETIDQGRVDWNDFAGRLVWSVTQEAKHSFLRDLARNSLRGNIARAKEGKTVGRAPFGYAKDEDGRYCLGDPVDVETVRRIYELRLQRRGYRNIAITLNQEQRPSPTGGEWGHYSIRDILDREAYIGTLVFGRKHRGKYSTATNGEIGPRNGHGRINKEPIKVANAHPAIIDLRTWMLARDLDRDPPKPHATAGKSKAPLAGLLICGRCSRPMFAQSLHWKAGQHTPNYVCGGYMMGKGCGYCVVAQDVIHRKVANVIREKVLGESMTELVARIKLKLKGHPKSGVSDARLIVCKLEKQIDDATNRLLIVDARLVSDLEKKIFAMRAKLEKARVTLETESMRPIPDAAAIADEIWRLDEIIQNGCPNVVRSLLKRMFKHIRLDFESGPKSKRGQSYIWTGGALVQQSSEEWESLMGLPRFWDSDIRFAA